MQVIIHLYPRPGQLLEIAEQLYGFNLNITQLNTCTETTGQHFAGTRVVAKFRLDFDNTEYVSKYIIYI